MFVANGSGRVGVRPVPCATGGIGVAEGKSLATLAFGPSGEGIGRDGIDDDDWRGAEAAGTSLPLALT